MGCDYRVTSLSGTPPSSLSSLHTIGSLWARSTMCKITKSAQSSPALSCASVMDIQLPTGHLHLKSTRHFHLHTHIRSYSSSSTSPFPHRPNLLFLLFSPLSLISSIIHLTTQTRKARNHFIPPPFPHAPIQALNAVLLLTLSNARPLLSAAHCHFPIAPSSLSKMVQGSCSSPTSFLTTF